MFNINVNGVVAGMANLKGGPSSGGIDVATICSYIPRALVKTVNVRQLKNNPSDALRMARKEPVVVMNRDQPEAVLFHLDDEGLLGEPGVRLGLASVLYTNESISLGRAARVAGMPLAEFIQELGRQGIPVIRGNARTLREELKNVAAWRSRK